MDNDDKQIVKGILAASSIASTATLPLTITTAAPGILGAIGMTTATTVALPLAGIIALGGGIGFGAYKAYQHFNKDSD